MTDRGFSAERAHYGKCRSTAPVAVSLAGAGLLALTSAGAAGAGPPGGLRQIEPGSSLILSKAHGSVDIRSFAFAPARVTVEIGDVVVFTNRDAFDHTVTANDGSLDSRSIRPRRSWRMTVTGPLSFHCAFHPSMQGELVLR